MKTTNQSLFDLIATFDNAARVPALRAVVHSMMAKCIGSIRQHIRDQARYIRNDEDSQVGLDQRNELDENTRSDDDLKQAMGFEIQEQPLKQASVFHAVYDWASGELLTLISSKW